MASIGTQASSVSPSPGGKQMTTTSTTDHLLEPEIQYVIEQKFLQFDPGYESKELRDLNSLLRNIKDELLSTRTRSETRKKLQSGAYFARLPVTGVVWHGPSPDKFSILRGTLLLSVAIMLRDPEVDINSTTTKVKALILTDEHQFFEAITTSKMRYFLNYLKDFGLAWEVLSLVRRLPRPDYAGIRDSLGLESFRRNSPAFSFSILTLRDKKIHTLQKEVGQLEQSKDEVILPGGSGYYRPSSVHWIHVPSTNGFIIRELFRRCFCERPLSAHGEVIETLIPGLFRDGFEDGAGDPLLNYRDVSYQSETLQQGGIPLKLTTIVFPCLILTTVGRQRSARVQHAEKRRLLRPNSEFEDCIWHFERTLDEAYYPGLDEASLRKRNDDQTVSRSGHSISGHEHAASVDVNAPLLIVPQLWIWRVNKVLISAHSLTEESGSFDGRLIAQDFSRDPFLDISSILDADIEAQVGLLLASAIDQFGKGYSQEGVVHRPTLDLFEDKVVGIMSEVSDYVDNGTSKDVQFVKERYFSHVISDIRNELAMITHFLGQQEEILNSLLSDRSEGDELVRDYSHWRGKENSEPERARVNQTRRTPEYRSNNHWRLGDMSDDEESVPLPREKRKKVSENWARVRKAEGTLKKYQKRVKKIDGDAERIERSVQDLLNLKRTHASIQEAHDSYILSTAVIGFTVVTIVFAPLAFLTALFALKVDGFGRLQTTGTDGVYNSGKLGGIFVGAEMLTLFLTWLSIKLAFWYTNHWDQAKTRKDNFGRLWRDIRAWFDSSKSKPEPPSANGNRNEQAVNPRQRDDGSQSNAPPASDVEKSTLPSARRRSRASGSQNSSPV